MELIHDLESDLAVAMLLEKKLSKKIEAKEAVDLITRVNETLESVSAKDHSYSDVLQDALESNLPTNTH